MEEKIGLTGDQFISKLESRARVGDPEVMGLGTEDLAKIYATSHRLSDIIRKLKAKNMKDFAWGWASRISAETIERMMHEREMIQKALQDPRMRELAEMLTGKMEKQKAEKDASKLSYIS